MALGLGAIGCAVGCLLGAWLGVAYLKTRNLWFPFGVHLAWNWFQGSIFGISVSGANALVERNTVSNFSADGLRGLGNFGTFQYNVVKNCYDVNENHDDGFQSWSVGTGGVGTGEVVGVVTVKVTNGQNINLAIGDR